MGALAMVMGIPALMELGGSLVNALGSGGGGHKPSTAPAVEKPEEGDDEV